MKYLNENVAQGTVNFGTAQIDSREGHKERKRRWGRGSLRNGGHMVRTWMEACEIVGGVEVSEWGRGWIWNFYHFPWGCLELRRSQMEQYIWVSDSLRMEEKSGPAVITSLLPQVCNIAVLLVSVVSIPALSLPVNYVARYRYLKHPVIKKQTHAVSTLVKDQIKSLCSSERVSHTRRWVIHQNQAFYLRVRVAVVAMFFFFFLIN